MKYIVQPAIIIVLILGLSFMSVRTKDCRKANLQHLSLVAEEKMEDLIRTGYFGHENSDGCDFKCRIRREETDYSWMGENLYRGKCDIRVAMEMWEESPTHKHVLDHSYTNEVILSEEYKEGYCYIILIRAEL